MTIEEQLAWARRMLDHAEAATAGVWPRASALLARHALEELLDEFWAVHAPPLVATRNRRAQMIALRGFPAVAESVAPLRVAYAGLSAGCHHHPYELPPTRAELDGLITAVEGFAVTIATLRSQVPPTPPPKPGATPKPTPRSKRG
jgi:hypothetical protein